MHGHDRSDEYVREIKAIEELIVTSRKEEAEERLKDVLQCPNPILSGRFNHPSLSVAMVRKR